MKKEEFQTKLNEMQTKIGDEASGLILDDIGMLLTDNEKMNNTLTEKDTEIQRLKQMNEALQRVNGNLLQQVSMGSDEDNEPEPEPKKIVDFREGFDENRKF